MQTNKAITVKGETYNTFKGFVKDGNGGIRPASQDDPVEAIINLDPHNQQSSTEVDFASWHGNVPAKIL